MHLLLPQACQPSSSAASQTATYATSHLVCPVLTQSMHACHVCYSVTWTPEEGSS